MKRLALGSATLSALFALLALPPTASARGTFDAGLNGIRLDKAKTLRTYDFESAESLVGARRARWIESDGFPDVEQTPITNAAEVAGSLTDEAAIGDAIEGKHAFRAKGGEGLAIVDPALFSQVKDGRFEVTLWARADGTPPQISVVYDRAAEPTIGSQFASVRAVRTGRETDDGWAEFSTGPIDGSVWGVPARGLLLMPSYYAESTESFLVDALEITRADGKPMEPRACTAQTVDAVCGAEGDCMYGHCVASTFTWGVLPTIAQRREIAERWITFGTRMMGDRNASQNGEKILTPNARLLAKTALSSRQFFGGLNRLVNLLRDNHTSFGSPANFTSFAPQVDRGTSSLLGACFGVVDKDLLGGGYGYAVFRSLDNPASGVPLKRGDVIFAIDGRDPKQWVDEVFPQVATTLPNDPASDWGNSANALSRLIATRANNVTLLRCANGSSCSGADRETITIDVASAAFKALTQPAEPSVKPPQSFSCSQRFTNAVAPSGGSNFSGEDRVDTATGDIGETRVQFDGFVGEKKWPAAMTNIFAGGPARVLMDARMGHGGYYTTVQHLFNLLRGTNEPMGVLSMGRGTYDLVDPPWLLSRLGKCVNDRGDFWGCFQGSANGFFASKASVPGGATRIAWLNTYDVSANDFMPRLLKGRTNVRIFAPHPTAGAFGAITSLPALWAGYSGGSLQIQDARFAPNLADAAKARWESGHGVEPDLVVAQKLSDAINGIDTILVTATAWLAEQ